jgi:hypothetical protein
MNLKKVKALKKIIDQIKRRKAYEEQGTRAFKILVYKNILI